MANNREISQFASFLTVDESANNNVGIATTVRIAAGGLYVDGVEVIGPGGAWRGPNSGLVGAQGAQGAPGAQGDVGAQGTQGADGAQGNQGYQGRQGADGAQGNQGYQGRQGAPGAQGAQGAPAAGANGKVLQVKQTFKTDTFVTASTSFTNVTGLSVSITPSSTSSKILVTVNGYGGLDGGNKRFAWKLIRGSTDIAIANAAGSRTRASGGGFSYGGTMESHAMVVTKLDSPSTTSSVTYNVQVAAIDGDNFRVNYGIVDSDASSYARFVSSITAIEIGP